MSYEKECECYNCMGFCENCYNSDVGICINCNNLNICLNCLAYGNGQLCANCEHEDEGIDLTYDIQLILAYIVKNDEYFLHYLAAAFMHN